MIRISQDVERREIVIELEQYIRGILLEAGKETNKAYREVDRLERGDEAMARREMRVRARQKKRK